jgi:HSP20 family protein
MRNILSFINGEMDFDSYFPPSITNSDKGFKISLDVPGYGPEDIKIEESDGILLISGDIEKRKFRKSYSISSSIDRSKIKADLKHGVLTIEVPKKASKKTTISVN